MITIDLTEHELQTLMGLMNAGVRAVGLSSVTYEAASLMAKIGKAVEVSNVVPIKDKAAS